MERTFVYTAIFDKQWENMGLNDEDQRQLELEILRNPNAGKVIIGTNGLRKVRVALEGRGKSGGARVLFIDIIIAEVVYFIYAYQKGEQDNISHAQRKQFKALVTKIKKEIGGNDSE